MRCPKRLNESCVAPSGGGQPNIIGAAAADALQYMDNNTTNMVEQGEITPPASIWLTSTKNSSDNLPSVWDFVKFMT